MIQSWLFLISYLHLLNVWERLDQTLTSRGEQSIITSWVLEQWFKRIWLWNKCGFSLIRSYICKLHHGDLNKKTQKQTGWRRLYSYFPKTIRVSSFVMCSGWPVVTATFAKVLDHFVGPDTPLSSPLFRPSSHASLPLLSFLLQSWAVSSLSGLVMLYSLALRRSSPA